MSENTVPSNLVQLFRDRVATSADRPALHIKRDGRFEAITWNELAVEVSAKASVLRRHGLKAGDRIAQLSENRYEWVVADLAIMTARGVHVPIHAPLTGPQAAFQIANSGAEIVLFSTQAQGEKLAAVAKRLPDRLQFFSYDDCQLEIGGARVESWKKAECVTSDISSSEIIDPASEALTADSLASILYTSGTTGKPKGVCLLHRNLVSNSLATKAMFEQQEGDRRLNILPLSHIFARTCDLYTWIAGGTELAIAENRETVISDAQEIQPTHISGVPYFYDKIYRGLIEAGATDQPGAAGKLLGGRLRMCACGGAALPNHLYDFFQQQGLPVYQGYGLTEASPVLTVSLPGAVKRGSVGLAIPDVEIRIDDDGEILTRGPHVMQGYWKDEAATRQVISDDGWLATGDLGHLDDEGFLFIRGRKKEIIVTAAGKNVAPVLLETLLSEDPLIIQAMIVGDDRRYLSALIVPHLEHLRAEIDARKIRLLSQESALDHPKVFALYEERIRTRLKELSHHEQVRRFTLLDRGFTIESGELTPKLSLRRQGIAANWSKEIESMYRDM